MRKEQEIKPSPYVIQKAVNYQRFAYVVFVMAWIVFYLWGATKRDNVLLFDGTIFLIAACTYYLAQKIDSFRLEMRKNV